MYSTTEELNLEHEDLMRTVDNQGNVRYIPKEEHNMGIAQNWQKFSGVMGGVSAMGEVMKGFSDFQNLRFTAAQNVLQGEQAGIIAEEKANLLREKVMGDISSSIASAGARGISVSSGTPLSLTESAMREAGEDVSQLRRTAKTKQKAFEAQAKMLKSQSRVALTTGILSGVTRGAKAGGTYGGLF